MKRLLHILIISLCLIFLFSSVYASKKRRRDTPTPKKPTTTTTKKTTSQEKRKSPKKSKKGKTRTQQKKNADDLYKEADSLFFIGDSSVAAEKMASIVDDFSENALADKALLSAGEYWVQHGKAKETLDMIAKHKIIDETMTGQVELIRIKAIAATGRAGYALFIARNAEIEFAGTEWGTRARAMANSITKNITPIFLGTTNEKQSNPDMNAVQKDKAK